MTTTYKVQGPDGVVHLIQGPDNASPADIEAFASQSIPSQQTAAMRTPTQQAQQPLGDSILSGAKNLLYGAAKGIADPIYGVTQLGMHGLNALSGGYLQNATDQYDNVLKNIEDTYQNDTPGSVAAGVGRVAGNLAAPMKTVALVKGATIVPRLVNAGATGAVIGATQPVTTGNPDYLTQKAEQVGIGAVGGSALSAAGAVAGGGLNAIRPLASPRSATGNLLLNGFKQNGFDPSSVGDLLTKLDSATPLVPGSLPTTAQIAGVPALVMAEKTMRNNPAYLPGFIQRANNNNDARLSELRDIAQTPDALAAATQARSDAATPLYDAAAAEVHPVDTDLQSILGRPSAQAALTRGQALAKEQNATIGVQGSPASPILGANGQPLTAATAPTVDGKTLQYLKMGIDDLQKEGATAGIGSHEAAALGATKDDLDAWLTKNSPTYQQANQTYAKLSVPISTMKAGQSVLDALEQGTLNSAGDVAPTLSQFRSRYAAALKDAPYGIDPAAQQRLDAIQSDLQRETVSNSVRAGSGSDTAFNLQAPNWLSGKLFGEGLDGSSKLGKAAGAVGGFLTGGPMGAYGGLKASQALGDMAGSRVSNQLSQALLDPAFFAQLLRDAQARANPPNRLAGTVGGALFMKPSNLPLVPGP